MSYVHVAAEDLQIGDLVRGRGRLACNVTDHDTRPGYVVAIFEKKEEETLVVLRADSTMRVRCEDEERS